MSQTVRLVVVALKALGDAISRGATHSTAAIEGDIWGDGVWRGLPAPSPDER